MNEFKTMFDQAVSVDDVPVDPAADIARGRDELRRRRTTRTAIGAAGLAVVAAVGGVAVTSGSGDPGPAVVAGPAFVDDKSGQETGTSSGSELTAIDLVTYTGKQVPGYAVQSVPEGWEIQGGSNTVLTLAPKNFSDQDINTWTGKIAVMLQSEDASDEGSEITDEELKSWGMQRKDVEHTDSKITVNGKAGSVSRSDPAATDPMVVVRFPDAKGHDVIAQGPLTLDWDDTRWTKFAEGITVLTNAAQGHG